MKVRALSPQAIFRAIGLGSARRQLLVGTAAFFVLRLLLALFRTGPVVVADEVGYLTNARVLAGGVPGQMSTAPFYRGGYSLLVAPLLAADGNPATSYQLVLVLNAVLAASLAPLLYLLLTRCFEVPARSAVWPALAAAAYPSVTIYTQLALTENLLLPLVVLWLVCFGNLLEARTMRRRLTWGGATSFCAAFLWAVHGRMIVAIGLTVVAFLALLITRRPTARAALLGLAIMAAGVAAVHLLDHFLVTRNYGGQQPDEAGQRLSTLDNASGVFAFLRNLVGQTWYLMVASLGVTVAAGVAAGSSLLENLRRRRATSSDLLITVMLLTTLGLLVVSALSFPDVERPDMFIYGRYTEVALPPLLAVALVVLAGEKRRARTIPAVIVLVGVTVAAISLRVAVHPPRAANRLNVASLPFVTFGLGPAILAGAGVVAALVLTGLGLLVRRSPMSVAPAALVLFLPTTAVAEREPVLSSQHSFYPPAWTSPARAAPSARVIAFDTDHGGGLFVYQWFMPHARFVLFSGAKDRPPSRFVISSHAWGASHARFGPAVLWNDPGRDRALFRLAKSAGPATKHVRAIGSR